MQVQACNLIVQMPGEQAEIKLKTLLHAVANAQTNEMCR
jgi:hypothetical protein